jgi:hypothetical protein
MTMEKKVMLALTALALGLLSGCDQKSAGAPKDLRQQVSNKCALDRINGVNAPVVYSKTGAVDFRGWAFDSNSNTAPEFLNVVLTSKQGKTFLFGPATRIARPDVVKAYKQDAPLQSGFSIVANVSNLEKDTYLISLQMPTADSLVTCKIFKVLVVN